MNNRINVLPSCRILTLFVLIFGFNANITVVQAADEFSNAQAVERVTIKFSQGSFSFLSSNSTRKVLPPSDLLPQGKDLVSGFWYELQDAEGGIKYRRIIHNPVIMTFEGPDIDTPGATAVDRKEGIPSERIFSVLIPQSLTGDALVLFSSPIELGAQASPAEEVARLPLQPIIIN